MAQNVKTICGVALASCKTVGGLAIASAKTIMGVDNTAGGGGTPAWVQDDGADFDPFNSVRSVTFTSSTTSGNCIVAIYRGSNQATLVVTDNKSNTYTNHVNGATSGTVIAVAPNITGGASHQVTFTVTSHALPGTIIVMEVSGVATSSPFDDGDQVSNFVANISATLTTSVNNCFLVGVMSSNTANATAGSGLTLRHTQSTVQSESGVAASSGSNAVAFVHSERTANLSAIALKPA